MFYGGKGLALKSSGSIFLIQISLLSTFTLLSEKYKAFECLHQTHDLNCLCFSMFLMVFFLSTLPVNHHMKISRYIEQLR